MYVSVNIYMYHLFVFNYNQKKKKFYEFINHELMMHLITLVDSVTVYTKSMTGDRLAIIRFSHTKKYCLVDIWSY